MQPGTRGCGVTIQEVCRIQDREICAVGVGNPGGSDLIGYRRVTVTPEMVGQDVAVFAAVEVKTARGRVKAEQQRFVDHIRSAGGIAGIARSVDEAMNILLM